MSTAIESITYGNSNGVAGQGELVEMIVQDEAACARHRELWERAVAEMDSNPEMDEAGMERYLEVLESVPDGYEFFGSWNEGLYTYGLQPTAAGETIIIGPAYDALGVHIEGHVNLALMLPTN